MSQVAAASRVVEGPGTGTVEILPLPTDEATLLEIVTELFERWWPHIMFGPIIDGAAWEIRATGPPRRISTLDGYVTVDLGDWHFHLCIGEHTGHPGGGVDPVVAASVAAPGPSCTGCSTMARPSRGACGCSTGPASSR